jgi:hypothetical protein
MCEKRKMKRKHYESVCFCGNTTQNFVLFTFYPGRFTPCVPQILHPDMSAYWHFCYNVHLASVTTFLLQTTWRLYRNTEMKSLVDLKCGWDFTTMSDFPTPVAKEVCQQMGSSSWTLRNECEERIYYVPCESFVFIRSSMSTPLDDNRTVCRPHAVYSCRRNCRLQNSSKVIEQCETERYRRVLDILLQYVK